MVSRITSWCGALALAAASSGALVAEAQTAPVRMVDETELYVRLWTPSPEGGYQVRVDSIVYGVGSDQDAIRLDVRQGSRALTSVRCPFDARDEDAGRLRCETSSDTRLTATGDITVDMVYVDDVAESTEVIRTLNLRVNAYPYWVRSDGSRQIMGSMYQIDGSDQLGTAFAYMEHPSLQQTEANESQRITFYTSFSGSYSGRSAALRCMVDGQRIPDRRVSWSSYADYGADERLDPTSDTRHVGWYRSRIQIEDLWWGPRIPLPASGSGYNTAETQFLGEHPGLWSCDLRSEGNVLRTFRFQVDAAGRVAAHAEESGAGAMRVLPGLHLIDVRLPTPNAIDAAVDPAAIRRASQYGRAWTSGAAVAEMLGALPAASGSSAPTATRGGGGGGRRGGRR